MNDPIDTQRLRLRNVRPGDEHAIHRLLSDERVIRYMLFPTFTPERAKAFVARFQEAGVSAQPTQIVRGIEFSETPDAGSSGELIGLCGLVLRPELEEGELWYLLQPDHWGRGLVTEAVGALVDRGFHALHLHRIWATCLPENPGSARVLEKLGFRREGLMREGLRIHGQWRDAFLYAILGSEWQTRRPSSAAQPNG